jgi:hypothetical protein
MTFRMQRLVTVTNERPRARANFMIRKNPSRRAATGRRLVLVRAWLAVLALAGCGRAGMVSPGTRLPVSDNATTASPPNTERTPPISTPTSTDGALSSLSAKDVRGPSPLVAIENEPPPRLIVDPPLPEPLAQGRVFIQYRTEHLRILPVFGQGALAVSPRIGHVHITVDDAGWHFVDASGETVILVGLAPGQHRVLFELADPTHRVLTSQTVTFTVPDVAHPPVTGNVAPLRR